MISETLAPNHLQRCIAEYEQAIHFGYRGKDNEVPFYVGAGKGIGSSDFVFISDENRFLPFVQTLKQRAKEKALKGELDPESYGKPQYGLKAKTKKGRSHELVGLVAMCYPEFAFDKKVFSRNEPDKVVERVEEQYQADFSVGISTSFGSAAEMKSSPFWFGRRGGIVDEKTFQRFFYGENEENGYWEISESERKKYPWLVKGYLKTVEDPECRIVESIVTSHPVGYAENPRNNFVARLYPYKCGFRIEMMGGTANLRDMDSHTNRQDLICFNYDETTQNPKVEIGSSYLLGPDVKQPLLRDILTTYEGFVNGEISRFEIFKSSLCQLRRLASITELNSLTATIIIKYLFKGLKQGIVFQNQNNRIPQVEDLISSALKMVKQSKEIDLPEEAILRNAYEQVVQGKILEFKDVMLRSLMPGGSSFLLRDILEFAQIVDSSCLEFIGEVNSSRRMFRLYELRYQTY